MNRQRASQLVEKLIARGIQFDEALSDAEVRAAQTRYRLVFPPDLRTFLQCALPVGQGFPNWRAERSPCVNERLALPLNGILFDVRHGEFWEPAWGKRPASTRKAIKVARRRTREAPTLVPIYGHRYIPTEPDSAGNPVLSVSQTDVIYYGAGLEEYLMNEFLATRAGTVALLREPRRIRFWSRLVELNT